MKKNINMKIRIIIIAVLVAVLLIATSCVKDEMNVGPAIVENVTMAPTAPQSTELVAISAKITDLKGITSAKLYYKAEGTATFNKMEMTSLSSQQYMYAANIPAFAKDTKVQYYIEVINNDNITSYYPAKAPTTFASYTVGASNIVKLFVNEVFPDGTKDATDPDWVELYNDSEIEVDLSGYAFYDDGIKIGAKPKRILQNGLKIAAKGFLVLKAESYASEFTVEFGLSTSGDAVYIDNKEGVLVASLDFNGISTAGKKSYGRKPDGSSTLVLFNNATKGASNNSAN